MPTITITVTDRTSAQLKALNESLRGGELIAKLGMGLVVALKGHFKDRSMSSNSDSKRAARGMPQYGIWKNISGSTSYAGMSGNVASVGISEPAFRAKLFGLTGMTAQRSTYLTIPLDPRVYGKKVANTGIQGIFKWTSKKTGKSYLAISENGGIKVLYRLMLSVTVPPDDQALPTDEQVMTIERGVIKRFLDKQSTGTANE